MSRTYAVSLPNAEAVVIEAEAKKLNKTVPELIREAVRARNKPSKIQDEMMDYLVKELTTIGVWMRTQIKGNDELVKEIQAGVRVRLEALKKD
jgi:hypothetical protein